MRNSNIIIWDKVQNPETAYLNRITLNAELLERMATIYAHLGDIVRVLKMKWLLLAKEQGGYKIEYFCEAWK